MYEIIIKYSSFLFGGVGFMGWFMQYRKSNADITKQIQDIYREMIKDVNIELTELRLQNKNLKLDLFDLKKKYYELKNK